MTWIFVILFVAIIIGLLAGCVFGWYILGPLIDYWLIRPFDEQIFKAIDRMMGYNDG